LKDEIEEIMEKVYYDKLYDSWVKNFALNLENISKEPSSRILSSGNVNQKKPVIVIGKGPSLKEKNHLEKLAKSNFDGKIVCCDGSLITTLKAGVTPEKFPEFFVVSIEGRLGETTKYYDDDIVKKYGSKIKGLFSTVTDSEAVECARKNGIKIHWFHALFDYEEGKKSFNHISALMVRAKNHPKGLPGIQTGGNVGTTSWFVSWQILKSPTIVLIGMNHGWSEKDPIELITSHGHYYPVPDIDQNSALFNKLFPKIYNPEFDCYCILDPVFQYYSNGFKEFISRSPQWVNTINATEGGVIFGDRIKCMVFTDFLKNQ
jgi:hypothetical protein|tara:strand:+ start:156 stop:1109 length:954 start_codon:yes stop_codon:yes gene_type:complete